jgi:beta-glucosidase
MWLRNQVGKMGLVLFNIKSVPKIKEVQKIAAEKPIENSLLFGMDVIHGYETTSIPLGLSATV